MEVLMELLMKIKYQMHTLKEHKNDKWTQGNASTSNPLNLKLQFSALWKKYSIYFFLLRNKKAKNMYKKKALIKIQYSLRQQIGLIVEFLSQLLFGIVLKDLHCE